MDLSKLPKLSETPPPPPAPTETPPTQPQVVERVIYVEQAAPGGAEAWISGAMGALILLLNLRLIYYLFSSPTAFDSKYTFTDAQGNPLAYKDSVFFWSDICIVAFAFVLILDAIVLSGVRRRGAVLAAFLLTVVITAANLLYLILSYNVQGLAIMSAIAVAYGGYVALFEWRLYKILIGRGRQQIA